ncbi:MAG: NlpC/P60 family protein [Pseudonocardiales bacterium]
MQAGPWRFCRSTFLLRTSLVATMVVALAAGTAGGAAAVPAASAASAHRQVAALQVRMQHATEDYDAARERVKATAVLVLGLKSRVTDSRARLAAMQKQADVLAATAYRDGGTTAINSVLTAGGPQEFIDGMTTLQHLSTEQRAQLKALGVAHKTFNEQMTALASLEAKQAKIEATLKATKKSIESDLAKWRKLADAADAAAAARASRSSRSAGATAFPTLPVTGSGRGAVALRFAMAQMGKPYAWGASGPDSYDCSGLTMASWRAAGISLPHSSAMQYAVTAHVSRSQMRPGDLVFFFSPISHVAIFVSGDTVIGAPTTGDVVRYQSISSMSYSGSSRPG